MLFRSAAGECPGPDVDKDDPDPDPDGDSKDAQAVADDTGVPSIGAEMSMTDGVPEAADIVRCKMLHRYHTASLRASTFCRRSAVGGSWWWRPPVVVVVVWVGPVFPAGVCSGDSVAGPCDLPVLLGTSWSTWKGGHSSSSSRNAVSVKLPYTPWMLVMSVGWLE